MSEANFEFDEDAVEQQPKDPVRAHLRKLEAENKALKEQVAAKAEAERKLAFVEAGIDLSAPGAKYFVKGYDGELSPEAIRQAAEEASLIRKQDTSGEQQAWNRVAQAARAGETSEPVVDYSAKIKQARSADEVMQLLAQARAEAEKL
jgi:hypothetical protein